MKHARFLIFFAAIAFTAVAGGFFSGGSEGVPTIDWYTIDGGGGTSTGGGFELSGTIGQPDAGPEMSGGGFTLTGGFWHTPPNDCPADLNGDDLVNVNDLLVMLTVWGPCPGCPADLNGDGNVNVIDLLELLTAWGAC